jgi:hypothetical protein
VLSTLADHSNLPVEKQVFDEALPRLRWPEGVEDKSRDQRIFNAAETGHETLAVRLASISEWVDFFSLRAALAYLPDAGNAVRDALAPARQMVEAIIREQAPAQDVSMTTHFYNALALQMDILTARKIFPGQFEAKENEQ